MQSAAEIAIGLIYAIGAVFNTSYTLRHSQEFYGQFAEKAWLRPARFLTSQLVVPHGVAFTVALIAFQVGVAIAIFERGGAVAPALLVGASFAAVIALFSSPGGALGNVALAAIQLALAWTR